MPNLKRISAFLEGRNDEFTKETKNNEIGEEKEENNNKQSKKP